MVIVAIAAIAAWGMRREGLYALAWEAPIVGAVIGIRMAGKRQRLAAGVTCGAITGAALAKFIGIGGTVAGNALEIDVGLGAAVVGAMLGLFTVWVDTVASCILRSYKPPKSPGVYRSVD